MPLYEYLCKKCGHRLEKIHKFSDKPLKKCPECGGPLEKLISAPSVQFKGSGWYVTDYGKKGALPASLRPSLQKATARAKETKDSKDIEGHERHEGGKKRRQAEVRGLTQETEERLAIERLAGIDVGFALGTIWRNICREKRTLGLLLTL